jgi:transcriptional regulator with XRE-family HTH domain
MNTSGLRESALRSPTDIDKAVGANLRRLRLQRRQTLSDLAAALGISHQQLQKYETGANRLSVGMAARAAGTLGVPIEHLFRNELASDECKQDTQARLRDELRAEGTYYLEKARSKEVLFQMVEVLKILSSGA